MVSRRIAHCTDLMRQVWETSEFEARKGAIAEFNAANRFRKRGIALIPTKFGISFTTKFLNQVTPHGSSEQHSRWDRVTNHVSICVAEGAAG